MIADYYINVQHPDGTSEESSLVKVEDWHHAGGLWWVSVVFPSGTVVILNHDEHPEDE